MPPSGPASRVRRPRSHPRRLRRPVPRRWSTYRRPSRPRGRPWLSTRLRRLFWLWQPWALVGGWALAVDRFGLASWTLAVALIAYLLRFPERTPTLGLEHTSPVGSQAFLSTVVGLTGQEFIPGNTVDVLENGDAFYPAMLEAIASAEQSVTLEQYIMWAGEVSDRFAAALAERARAGVSVKLLLDAVGSSTLGDRALQVLKDAGCEVAWYNRIHWYTVGRFNNRSHRKTLIVDGRIGFTGGAGIADHWRGDARGTEEWRDTQVRIEGPAVHALQHGFAINWLRTTGEVLQGEAFFPTPPAAGPTAVQVINSSPDAGASGARLAYYLAIVSSRKRIDIVNPYFVPDEVAVETLAEAAARGVQVRVLVTGVRNDNWLARHNSVRLYGPLLEGGVKVYEYHPRMLHQKVMIVDGCWCSVGTSNFDNRSFALNEETTLCVCDESVVAALSRAFDDDLAESREVSFDAWRRRGLWARVQELVASLLRDQV
jgi:cardiolipin synthase